MECGSLVIADASVLIDLYNGGVLDAALRLPLSWAVVEAVAAVELLSPSFAYLLDHGVTAITPDPTDAPMARRFRTKHKGLSAQDCLTLAVCVRLGAVLLTGDQVLRRVAAGEGLEVRGTLWVLDELVARAVIQPSQAASALERMLESGSRLPWGPCRARLKVWRER